MRATVLDRIETRSGVDRRLGESPAEYVRRVGDRADVEEALTDRTRAELAGAARPPGGPDPQVVEAFLDSVSDRASDDAEGLDRERSPPGSVTRLGISEAEAMEDDPPGRATSPPEESDGSGSGESDTPSEPRSVWGWTVTDCVFVVAILAFSAHLFRNLGGTSLHRFDESIYGNAAKHMLTHGEWLVPHVRGYYFYQRDIFPPVPGGGGLVPFLEKPPLVFWLQALSMKVFGINEFAVRFQSAVFAVLTAFLVYFVTREVADRRAGFLAGVVFLAAPFLFARANGATQGGTDMAVVFFGSLMTYLVWRAVREDDPRWLVYASLPAVGAVLSKGFDAGVWVFVVVPLLLLSPWLLFSRVTAKAVGITTALCALWPLYAWYRVGETFVDVFLVGQLVDRIVGEKSVEGVDRALFDFMGQPYFHKFLFWNDPWVYLLVPGTVYLVGYYWRSDHRAERRTVLFVTWWFVCIFGFYLWVGTNAHYIIKALVPAAILVGWFLGEVSRGRAYSRVALLSGVVPLLAFSPRMKDLSPLHVSVSWLKIPGDPLTGTEFVALAVGALVVLTCHRQLSSVLGTVVGAARWLPVGNGDRRLSSRHYRVGTALVSAGFVVFLMVSLVGSPVYSLPHTSAHEELAGVVDEETPEGATVYVTADALEIDGNNYATLGFYSDGREIQRIGNKRMDSDWRWIYDPEVKYLVASREEIEAVDESRYRILLEFTEGYWGDGREKVFVEFDRSDDGEVGTG